MLKVPKSQVYIFGPQKIRSRKNLFCVYVHVCLFIFSKIILCWRIVGYHVVLVSDVQHSESVIYLHESILFQILFPFRLLHNFEQNSLCYTVGPYWLSVLNIECVHVNPKLPVYLSPSPLVTISLFSKSVSLKTLPLNVLL